MLWLVALLIGVSTYCWISGIIKVFRQDQLVLETRLQTLVSRRQDNLEEELDRSFYERVIKPILETMAHGLSRLVPTKKKISLQKKLAMAGNPGGLGPNEFLVLQYAVTGGLVVLALFLVLPQGLVLWKQALVLGISVLAGFLLPEYYLKSKSSGRQEEIKRSLPDVLDLLTVSVEAGLGFDAALAKVVEKTHGVLADEFARVLNEVKMGKPRREALRDLGHRSGVDDLNAFLGAVIQADQLGVSIGNVLRLQSEQMRSKRRQRAEEKAMKAPIKMLIPLIFFIFPTIFIVLLGPAIIEFMNTIRG